MSSVFVCGRQGLRVIGHTAREQGAEGKGAKEPRLVPTSCGWGRTKVKAQLCAVVYVGWLK
eukprot:scaffold33876_cov77-Phaeocystis_antarctica.AAC.4